MRGEPHEVSIGNAMRVRQTLKDEVLRGVVFVYASFEFDEPLICGFGATKFEALAMVRESAGNPDSVVCCQRVVTAGNELLWRDRQGRTVRSCHFRAEVRKEN